MNFEFFISQRLISEKNTKNSISGPIIKIAIIAISLGISMMLIAFATGMGLQDKIREKITAFNGDINITKFSNNQSKISLDPISTEQDFYPTFNHPEVSHIQAVATKFGIVRTENDFEAIITKGVEENYEWRYFKEYLVEGRIPNYTGKISKEILISEYLANRLHFKMGDQVVVYFLKDENSERPRMIAFDIVGIYNSGFEEFDKSFLIADLKQLRRINKWNKDEVGYFEILVKDFENIGPISEDVYQQITSELDVENILQKYPNIFEWLSMFDMNIIIIISLMIIVAGINMITALLVLILERTPMIGILKALGANNWKIRKIFLINASYIILKGIFFGNLIGLGLLLIQKYVQPIKLDPRSYYVTEVPVYIDFSYIAFVNLGTLILCLLFLIIPSIIVTKISPVKAIKFD
ncbi:MAG: FtsX-like permease family protein [Psychroflexus maritimus]